MFSEAMAMQGIIKPKRSGLRPTPGRTDRNEGESRDLAREAAAPTVYETTRAQVYRWRRWGNSVHVLANRFGLNRSRIEGLTLEMRARRLLESRLEFVKDPSFDGPAAVAELLGPPPEPASGQGPRRFRAPHDLPSYLASLYEVPLLSRAQERYLFLKMNYLYYRAHQLRVALDPGHCDAAQLDEIERLQGEALDAKNQIIRANLRLVVPIAKRHVGPSNNFFELVSDGNMSLIRAVEKFDVSRGFKFSTYAAWAIVKNFSRSIPEEMHRRDRFVTGHHEVFAVARDTRGNVHEEEDDLRRSQEIIKGLLGRLDVLERRILISRYGISGADAQTLEQLGRELGVTKDRVRQIESLAHEKLRKLAVETKLDMTLS
jgi:RNA polymerase primary sigma factor